MKRSPIVAVGTVVGLASVLSFHSTPVKINLSAAASASSSSSSTTTPPSTTPPHTTTAPPNTTTTASQSSTGSGQSTTTAPPTTTTTVSPTTTTAVTTGIRTVTGPMVNYYYGQLAVKVTANGKKVTAVTIASISDGGNPLSVQIDHYAIPKLEPEAISAQSYNIQSVSGASYTSAGFQMSLQYALKKLGI